MSNAGLIGGVVGFIGAVAYDKVFNDGKVTDKIAGAGGGGFVTETIKETVTGGVQTIKETIVENNIVEKLVENPIVENVKEGLNNVKEGSLNLLNPDLSNFNIDLPKLPSSDEKSGYQSFKENGGLLGEASDILGFGWLGSKLKAGYDGAIGGSQKFYSGVYNIGTIVKGSVTGQEYEAVKVGDNYLNMPVKTPSRRSKRSRSSSSSSSSSNNFVGAPKPTTTTTKTINADNPLKKISDNVYKSSGLINFSNFRGFN